MDTATGQCFGLIIDTWWLLLAGERVGRTPFDRGCQSGVPHDCEDHDGLWDQRCTHNGIWAQFRCLLFFSFLWLNLIIQTKLDLNILWRVQTPCSFWIFTGSCELYRLWCSRRRATRICKCLFQLWFRFCMKSNLSLIALSRSLVRGPGSLL